MQVPAELLVVLVGIIITGLVFTGLMTLLGGLLLVLNIWEKIKPKTDAYATREMVAEVNRNSDRRFFENKDAIVDNRNTSERRFGEVFVELKTINTQMMDIGGAVARIEGHMFNGGAKPRRTRGGV